MDASPPNMTLDTESVQNLSRVSRSTPVTMSVTSAPRHAPNVTPIDPIAQGADHVPSGSLAMTHPVEIRIPPMNASFPTVMNSRPSTASSISVVYSVSRSQ